MPVKVAHLIHTLGGGGAERQLANMVSNTSHEVVEHVVCAFNRLELLTPQIREAGHQVIDLGVRDWRPFLPGAIAFRNVLINTKPDVIHSWLYDGNISARLARLSHKKIPIVTSLQLADYEPEAARIGNWNPHKVRALKAIDRFTSWLTDPYYVACSEFVAESYKRHFGLREDRSEVIPNSFDPEFLRPSGRPLSEIRDEIGIEHDSFVYLNIGRLDPQKNHAAMIAAFRELAIKEKDVCIIFVGIGSHEDRIKATAEQSGVSDRIFFLGRRSDIGDLLALADVYVFPSFFEGLPVALIEAMSQSLPCISSEIRVVQEVMVNNESGLLIDPGSVDDLVAAMNELFKNRELRERLGRNAHRVAMEKFSISANVTKWEDMYKTIAAQH